MKVMCAIESCPHGGARRSCRALRECAHSQISYNSCPQPTLPRRARGAAQDWLARPEANLASGQSPCRVHTLPAAIADIAYQTRPHLRLTVSGIFRTLITIAADQNTLGARVASPSFSIPVVRPRPSPSTSTYCHAGGAISLDGNLWGGLPGRASCLGARALAPFPTAVPGEASCSCRTPRAGHLKLLRDTPLSPTRRRSRRNLAPLRRP